MNLASKHQFYKQCFTQVRSVLVVALLLLNAVAFSAPGTTQQKEISEGVKTEVFFKTAYKKKKTTTFSYFHRSVDAKPTQLYLLAFEYLIRRHNHLINSFFHFQKVVPPERTKQHLSLLPYFISTSSFEDSLPLLNS